MSQAEQIAGVDEAGRGPLAGPVTAAAVILPGDFDLPQLTDSKKLSATKRERLYDQIIEQAVAYAITEATVEEIDTLNILQASMLAMSRAIAQLSISPTRCLIDGNRCPETTVPTQAIVGGDGIEPCISAASILAKVSRDRIMQRLDAEYPGYDFAKHKGYPTKQHILALNQLGPCSIHRCSFAPVAKAVLVAKAAAAQSSRESQK